MKVCWGLISQEARMALVCGLHTSAAGVGRCFGQRAAW